MTSDIKAKEQEERHVLESNISDLKEKLERKEFFMQSKEKKWIEIERLLQEYLDEDQDLKDRFAELRINILPNQKITNVVEDNEQLKVELGKAYREIDRMRLNLLDPFNHKRRRQTNINMPEKTDSLNPVDVNVSATALLLGQARHTPLVPAPKQPVYGGARKPTLNATMSRER